VTRTTITTKADYW